MGTEEVNRSRESKGVTLEALALKAGVSAETIRNWLSGRTELQLSAVVPIADALQGSHFKHLALLGLVPDDYAGAAFHLADFEADMINAYKRVHTLLSGSVKESDLSIANALARLLNDDGWIVELRPWNEGVPEYQMRAVDMLVLRSSENRDVTRAELQERFGDIFSLIGAAALNDLVLPGDMKTWLDEHERSGQSPNKRTQWAWLIPRLNVLRRASPKPVLEDPSSILILGTHLSTWATDVASLLGLSLGYGSANTNLLSRIFVGDDIMDASKDKRSRVRTDIANYLLSEGAGVVGPLVWAHTETILPVIQHIEQGRASPFVVYVRPTDRLHRYIANRKTRGETIESLKESRSAVENALLQSSTPHLIIDVGFPRKRASLELDRELRNLFLMRSMLVSTWIFAQLSQRFQAFDDLSLHPDAPPALAKLFLQHSRQEWADATLSREAYDFV